MNRLLDTMYNPDTDWYGLHHVLADEMVLDASRSSNFGYKQGEQQEKSQSIVNRETINI